MCCVHCPEAADHFLRPRVAFLENQFWEGWTFPQSSSEKVGNNSGKRGPFPKSVLESLDLPKKQLWEGWTSPKKQFWEGWTFPAAQMARLRHPGHQFWKDWRFKVEWKFFNLATVHRVALPEGQATQVFAVLHPGEAQE